MRPKEKASTLLSNIPSLKTSGATYEPAVQKGSNISIREKYKQPSYFNFTETKDG